MQILVTGATSIIGAPLVKQLVSQQHKVYAVIRPQSSNISRLSSVIQESNLTLIESYLADIDEKINQITDTIDVCFHFGWDGAGSENRKRRDLQLKNIADSMEVLKVCEMLGCKRFIFSGSQAEYGVHQNKTTEDVECVPISEYGKAKIEFMQQAKRYLTQRPIPSKMQYVHARIFSVYGPQDHNGSLINSCVTTFLQKKSIELGACEHLWNYLYIDDLISALLAIMNMDKYQEPYLVYNIAGDEDETKPLKDYIECLHQCCGKQGRYYLGKRSPNAEGGANLNPSIDKLKNNTGWKPLVSFEEGIQRIIKQRCSDYDSKREK